MGVRPLWNNPTISMTSTFVALAAGGDSVLWPPEPEAPPRPTMDDLVAEYRSLEAAHRRPDNADVLADFRWLSEMNASSEFEPYRGKYVAAMDRQIVHTGDLALAVRVEAAKKCRVHPGRFAVIFLYRWDDSRWDDHTS